MATRTHAREMVVELLYAYAMGNERIFDFADELLNAKKIRNAQADFAKGLFKGIMAHLQKIDSIIEANLKSWELSRLGVIDKCILRLGVYEILKGEIDAPVAINEAIEIAKILGAENTGKFVNGVLDAISKKGLSLNSSLDNSVLGMQFRTCENFQASTDSSLVESPKISTNTKATPQSLRLRFCESQNLGENSEKNAESTLDSANSQNLEKNNSCKAPKNSPASWCKKSESRLQKCNRRFFARSGESEALPLKAKKRSFLARRGSGEGGAALFAKETSESKKPKSNRLAKSTKKSTKSQNSRKDSKGGLPRFAKGKSRNDKSISKPTKRTRNDNIKSAKSAQKGNKK